MGCRSSTLQRQKCYRFKQSASSADTVAEDARILRRPQKKLTGTDRVNGESRMALNLFHTNSFAWIRLDR
jgi:hypothetical protein